jgi:hypothetical protein
MTVGELLNILDVEVERGALTLDSVVFVGHYDEPDLAREAKVDLFGDLVIS